MRKAGAEESLQDGEGTWPPQAATDPWPTAGWGEVGGGRRRKRTAKAETSLGISGEPSSGALTGLADEGMESRLPLLSIPIPNLFSSVLG